MSFTGWLSNRLRPSPFQRKAPAARPTFRPTLEAMEDRCLMSAGALDPTFGSGGMATPPASTAHGIANALAIYPDNQSNAQAATAGDVVAAGYVWKGNALAFGLARFTENGQADATFGAKGEVTTTLKSSPSSEAYAVAIQGDGKIVAAGTAYPGTTGNSVFALARYNVNGSLDSTFGSKGEVTTTLTGGSTTASNDYARAMFLQPDGKIVVAGTIVPSTGTAVSIGLARYNPNGTLDATFGSGGTVVISHTVIPGSLIDPTYGRTWIGNAVVQADGKILVAGYTQVTGYPNRTSNEAFVVRYNSNGTLDTSFGAGGVVALPPQYLSTANTPVGEVALEPSGEIVLTGFNQLALLHADGSFDPAFGNGGIAPNGLGSVALEPNGDIVTAATDVNGQVNRFLPDGTPDTTFGNGGSVTPFPAPYSGYLVTAFAVQPDGKIDVASGFDVGRLLPSEPQIGSFTASAYSVTAGSNVLLTASNITDANPNSTIRQVEFYYFDNLGNKVTLGTATTGTGGALSAPVTVPSLPAGIYTIYAQAEDSYGVLGDPLALDLQVQ